MKLNLPSTWTRRRILTSLLLPLLKLQETMAGDGFRNCLTASNYADYYNSLLNFPFVNNNEINNNQILSLCCNNSTSACLVTEPPACTYPQQRFFCNKIAQTIFCDSPHAYCKGVVGDALISSNTTIDTCKVDFETMENYLANSIDNDLSALKINKTGNYAAWICLPTYSTCSNSADLICGWDNGGWTCHSELILASLGNNTHIDANGKCYLQWKSPFPNKNNRSFNPFLNVKGLPTPWPIAIVGALVSLVSIFLFESESYSLGYLAKSLLAFNIVRSLITLIGSINSLRVGGIKEFEYPAAALLNNFTLLFLMLSVERGIEKLEDLEVEPEPSRINRFFANLTKICKEVFSKIKNFFIRQDERRVEEGIQVILLQNLERENIVSAMEMQARAKKRAKNLQALKRIFSLRYLCWGIIGVNFVWQLLAAIIYGLHKNLPVSAEFVTNCNEVPADTSFASYVECDENTRCFIKSWNNNFQDLLLRANGLFIVLFSIFVLCSIKRERLDLIMWPFRINLERWFGRGDRQVRNIIRYNIYGMISSFIAVQAIMSILFQTTGTLNVKGLEPCDIDFSITKSNTGYLQEWWNQELIPLKQLSLT